MASDDPTPDAGPDDGTDHDQDRHDDARLEPVDGDEGMPQETIDTPHNEPGSQAPPG
jgi:hypothetical protein